MFDGAERAIRCGLALVEALAAIRVPIRVGIHSGEVELTAERVRGVAVHAAARILDEARPGEVLVSGTTRDLAEGAADSHSSRGGDTALRVWSGSTTCSPRHHPPGRTTLPPAPKKTVITLAATVHMDAAAVTARS